MVSELPIYPSIRLNNQSVSASGNNVVINGVVTNNITGINYSTIFVDSIYGNDSLGQRNNLLQPFKTISGALAISQPTDTIQVWPGTYTDKNLTGNAVNLYFNAGSSLISTAATGTDSCFKFSTNGNFSVFGEGHFRIVNPLVTSGNVYCPSVFRITNTIVNIEAGLIEGYQTDTLKTGNHFLCIFSGGSGGLNLNCSNIAGNLPIVVNNSFSPLTGAYCMYGLFFQDNLSSRQSFNTNLNINCNNNINTLYDGSFSTDIDGNGQGNVIGSLQVQAGNTINCSNLIICPSVSYNSFYKSINLNLDNIIINYKDESSENYIYNIYCDFISNNNSDPAQTGYQVYLYDSTSASSDSPIIKIFSKQINNLDFDFRKDDGLTSSFFISSEEVISNKIQYLGGQNRNNGNLGGCILDVGIWTTNNSGFSQPTAGTVVIPGTMLVDSGFAQGNSAIAVGNLIVAYGAVYTL
jgi:hypothetical protein